MNTFTYKIRLKQALIDSAHFWSFWILVSGVFVGLIEGTFTGVVRSIVALIIPQILPVFIIGLLFDNLFISKKILLFMLTAIPFAYLSGVLINVWFHWVIVDVNLSVNNEIMIFVFAIMYVGYRYIKVAIAQRIMLKEEENKRVITELQYLRSQLNPHFLFNSLNTIYALILAKSDKAVEAVLTLSELMRFHIDLSGKHFLNLTEDLALLERYIELEKLKLDDRCDVKLNVIGNPENILIAPLIFMPFVENAFKHGITSNPKANFVHIEIRIDVTQVYLKITNSIAKNNSTDDRKTVKMGVNNTLKRLELHYKGNYSFSSAKKYDHYEVLITIKLKANAA